MKHLDNNPTNPPQYSIEEGDKLVLEAVIQELEKLYAKRVFLIRHKGSSLYFVKANKIKERIIELQKELYPLIVVNSTSTDKTGDGC
jgi:hypothetical protein